MNTYYIYKISNMINGMAYIGQHKVSPNGEWPRSYFGRGIKLKEAIKEFGRSNFKKEIIEYIEDDDARDLVSERERYWIKEENTLFPNGYNVSPGGIAWMTSEFALKGAQTRKDNGFKMAEETKKKISESNKEKPKSEIHKQHLSENHHLRTLHAIVYENGDIEETYLPISKIAKQHNTSPNTLLRKSSKKEFINGIYLADIDPKKYECCSHFNDKEKRQKLCHDPIKNEICTLCALRIRKSRNKDQYANVNINNCILESEAS